MYRDAADGFALTDGTAWSPTRSAAYRADMEGRLSRGSVNRPGVRRGVVMGGGCGAVPGAPRAEVPA
jgi:hypothetical protein